MWEAILFCFFFVHKKEDASFGKLFASRGVAIAMTDLKVATINPTQADILLQHRRPAARRNVNAVRQYAQAMRAKDWVLNGVPVIVSAQGVLVDGYQRLLACIAAETAFPTLLVQQSAVEAGLYADPRVSCVRETISPEQARHYLAQAMGTRRLSQARIAALAADLAGSREMFDTQPVCLARSGRLLKGRHRLRAIIRAGGAAEVAVVRGLDEAVAGTYDLGAKRRNAMAGTLDSFGDLALVAAMANLLWRHERKTMAIRHAKASAAEIQGIIAEHPRLLALRGFARRMDRYGRASVLGYAAYVMEREDEAMSAAFFAVLEDGPAAHPAHPMRTLCATLQALRRRKAPQDTQLATLLAGWKRFKGRELGEVRRKKERGSFFEKKVPKKLY
jgi:hypothetical protein